VIHVTGDDEDESYGATDCQRYAFPRMQSLMDTRRRRWCLRRGRMSVWRDRYLNLALLKMSCSSCGSVNRDSRLTDRGAWSLRAEFSYYLGTIHILFESFRRSVDVVVGWIHGQWGSSISAPSNALSVCRCILSLDAAAFTLPSKLTAQRAY
jgi:hypothetical protein